MNIIQLLRVSTVCFLQLPLLISLIIDIVSCSASYRAPRQRRRTLQEKHRKKQCFKDFRRPLLKRRAQRCQNTINRRISGRINSAYIIKIGNNEIVYTDSIGGRTEVPFYYRIPGTPSLAATEQVIYLDVASFFAKCFYQNNGVAVDVYNGNRLNGTILEVDSSNNTTLLKTDLGLVNISAVDEANPKAVELQGVQFIATKVLDNSSGIGIRLVADGNCSYTRTSDGYDYLRPVIGQDSSGRPVYGNWNELDTTGYIAQTVFFDDDDTSRGPSNMPIPFNDTAALVGNFNYRQFYSSTDDAVYLVLEAQQFTTEEGNKINFGGTDVTEDGEINLRYYWLDHEGFEDYDPGDTEYLTAIFSVRPSIIGDITGDGLVDDSDLSVLLGQTGKECIAGDPGFEGCDKADLTRDGFVNDDDLSLILANWETNDEAVVYIDPAVHRPHAFPNTDLSHYTGCVSYLGDAGMETLDCVQEDETATTANGTSIVLGSGMVTIETPVAG